MEKRAGFEKIKIEIEANIKAVKERQLKLKEIADGTQTSFNDMNYFLKNCKSQIDELNKKKQVQDVQEILKLMSLEIQLLS